MKTSSPPRSLRLIDAENMAGRSQLSSSAVRAAQARLERAAPRGAADHEVVAVSGTGNAREAFYSWAGPARFLLGKGHDGAEIALLAEVTDVEFIRSRYDRVVVASGDGRFASAVCALRSAGVEVLVIAPKGGTARSIRKAAGSDNIVYLASRSGAAAHAGHAA